jgi:phosphoglycerate dehydrogenase-like enzyme
LRLINIPEPVNIEAGVQCCYLVEISIRTSGFDMKVIYYDNFRPEEEAQGIEYRNFDNLLQEADFVSIHVPLIAETEHMISKRGFKLMKDTAYLIYT